MSVIVKYKFIIKKNKDIDFKSLLIGKHKINYDYLKEMPEEIKAKLSYDLWAKEYFGYDYNSYCDCIQKNDTLEINFNCNKNCLKFEPWFDKFKDNLEIYVYESNYRNIDPLEEYIHYFYESGIKQEKNHEEVGKKLKEIFLTDETNIKKYFINNFDMPEEFIEKDIDEVISIFISVFPSLFDYLPDKYKNNKEFLIKCINKNFLIYNYLQESKLLCDKDIILNVLTAKNNYKYNKGNYYNPDLLDVIKSNYMTDREIVKLFISQNKSKFKYFAKEYGDDKEIALVALGKERNEIQNYNYLSDRLKNDFDIAKEFAKYDLFNNEEFREKYKDNIELIKYVLSFKDTINILSKVSDDIKNNEEIVTATLKNNPEALEHIGEKYKNNFKLCLNILKKNPGLIKFVGDKLLEDYEFCNAYIKILKEFNYDNLSRYNCWRDSLQYIKNEEILSNKEFVIEAIKNSANLWFPNKVFMKYIDDEEIIIPALIIDNYLYQYLPDEYRDNEIYTIAALTNSDNIDALKEFPFIKKELSKSLIEETDYEKDGKPDDDRLFVKFVVFDDAGCNIRYASDRLRNDLKTALYAVKQTPQAYKHIGRKVKKAPEILKLLKKEKRNIKFDINFN